MIGVLIRLLSVHLGDVHWFILSGQDLLDFTGYFIFYFHNFPDESDEE